MTVTANGEPASTTAGAAIPRGFGAGGQAPVSLKQSGKNSTLSPGFSSASQMPFDDGALFSQKLQKKLAGAPNSNLCVSPRIVSAE